jgi:hypothetical protein
MKTDPIQKFILKNERNLRLAIKTSDVWLATRSVLVQTFQQHLKQRLLKQLKGWEFGAYDGEFFDSAWGGYYFWKPSWEDQYSLALQMTYQGEQAIIGVGRDKNQFGKRPNSAELFKAITKIHSSADSNVWWEAKWKMQSPAANWREPDVLWRMHKDKKFLEEVAEQLLELAEISVPIIDKLVRKYRK